MDKGIPRESYNIGSGTSITFNEIYKMVKEEMRSPVEAQHITNPLKSYQYFTHADISKAKKDFGFIPGYDLRSGIKKMRDYDIKSI